MNCVFSVSSEVFIVKNKVTDHMLLYLIFFITFWNTVEHHYSHCPNNAAASDSLSSSQELQNKKLMNPSPHPV